MWKLKAAFAFAQINKAIIVNMDDQPQPGALKSGHPYILSVAAHSLGLESGGEGRE